MHLTSKLSGTFQSASLAAQELGPDRITLVDSETASLSVAQLALAMQRRLERGTTDEELDGLVARFKQEAGVVFTVGTLEYLQKGGRIGKAQAMAGSLLNVKPILSVADGVIAPVARVRGRQKALEEFAKMFTEATENRAGYASRSRTRTRPNGSTCSRTWSPRRARRPRSRWSRTSALSSVRTPAPAPSGFFWLQD